MAYTYEVTTDRRINIYKDGVHIVFQPHNPNGEFSVPFADEAEATAWALATIADMELADIPPPPPEPNPEELAALKVSKKDEINLARDTAEASGFEYLGKTFDSDAQAIKRLYGAALAAMAAISGGMPASSMMVTWTCADGTTIDLSYGEMAAVPVTMASVANSLHVKARGLKLQVDAATTRAEIEAIVW